MPDSAPPPWQPDDAFWNEAWQDMDRRLDRRRRRRIPPFWYFLPLLLLPLLYFWAGPPRLSTGLADASRVKTTAEPEHARSGIAESADQVVLPKDVTVGSGTPLPLPSEATLPTPPTTLRDGNEGTAPLGLAVRRVATGTLAEVQQLDSTLFTTKLTDRVSAEPSAVAVLASLPLRLLDVDVPLPEATTPVKPTKRTERFYFSLGGLSYLSLVQPGGFAELGYHVGRSRWQGLAGVRYTYAVRDLRLDATLPQQPNDRPNPALNSSFAPVYVFPQPQEPAQLRTHQLELRTGVARRVGRWQLAAGVGATYLVGGRGPGAVIGTPYTPPIFTRELEELRYSDPTGAVVDAAAFDGPLISTSVRRWGATVWSGVYYRFAGRWQLMLGGTHAMYPLFYDETVTTGRTQLEVGIRKGL